MGELPQVTVTRLTPAPPSEKARGLLAYMTITLGAVHVDGVTLRRTADGRRYLAFPERIDRSGQRRPLVWPLDAATRIAIEAAVFRALGLQADSRA